MDRILFIVGLCILSFLYGAVTIHLEIFPYRLLREAKLASDAWAEVGPQRFPEAFKGFEAAAAAAPRARRLRDGAGQEHVLVTGGPYQLMERCPNYGCLAWITDREGRIVHTWEVNLDALWDGITGVSGDVNELNLYPIGMAYAGNGSLVATFQGRNTFPAHIGIIKVDRGGEIIWKRFDYSHHWPTIDEAGRIYTPAFFGIEGLEYIGDTLVEVECRSGITELSVIRVLSPDGEVIREIPVLEAFLRAGFPGLFYGVRDGCDPGHLNSIALVTEAVAAAIPDVAAGDLLVSLREPSAVALLDGKTGDVKHLVAGRTAAQHAPQFLPDGTVLAFDNRGGQRGLGGARVVRLDLVNGTSETVFPRGGEDGLLPVRSETAGQIDVSPDGRRALVAVTHQGRVIEIDVASGAPLWVYENTHDLGRFLEANNIDSDTSRARFATYGAYYLRDPGFLEGLQSDNGKGDEQ